MLVVAAVAPSAAVAQGGELPPCPSGREAVSTYPPDYVRRGASFEYSVQRARSSVTEVRVTTIGSSGLADVVEDFAFAEGEDEIEVVREVPTGRSTIAMRFDWLQDEGRPSACRGSDVYRDIPVISKTAKAGDVEAPRLAGRWAIRYGKGRTREDRTTWRLTPLCDVFGCRTRLDSKGGYRGSLTVQDDGTYLFEDRVFAGTCTAEYVDGSRSKFRFFAYITVAIKPSRVRRGVARGFTGKRTVEYEYSNEFAPCTEPRTERDRVTGSRL
jgi:hypothetical protein